MSIDWLCC